MARAAKKERKVALDADPRWLPFMERYAFNLYGFAVEVCGMDVTPQQQELFDETSQYGCRVSVSSGHGCFAPGTQLMLASGAAIAVENVRSGDRLMGAEGDCARTVLELKRGCQAMYRFTYSDGTSHTFNESHILCLVAPNNKRSRKVTVTVGEWLTWGDDRKRRYSIYRSPVKSFRRPIETLPVSPFVMGQRLSYAAGTPIIPDAYLYASQPERIALLNGLVGETARYFARADEELVRQVAWVARSVGYHATVSRSDAGMWFADIERQPRDLYFSIETCEALGEGDYYGFTLDGDHRLLGHDFTVLHNTGKTRSFGIIALWHLLCYPNSNTYITAPKLKTVREGVWKEITTMKTAIENGPHAWIAEYFTIQAEKVYVNLKSAVWYVTTRTAPRGSPENLAGTHGDYLLWLADEASGIPDANFGVIGGSMTDKRNRFVLASQPTRDSGFFRDTHHNMSKVQGGEWTALTFSSESSPLVSIEFIKAKLKQYGGRDDMEYQIKVRGMFPTNSNKYLLSRVAIERVIDGPNVILPGEAFGHLLIIDVAAGVGRDKTVVTHLRVIGNGDRMAPDRRRIEVVDIPVYTNTEDWTPICVQVLEYAARLSNAAAIVDTSGMGEQFLKRLVELDHGNLHAKGVLWGGQPFSNEYRQRFINQRAQATVHLAEAVKDGVVRFIPKYKKDLLDQGSRLPYYLDGLGRYHVASKKDMAAENLPSPDLLDTLAMAFLEDADYVPAQGESVSLSYDRKAAALAAAERAYAETT
ncbi:Hint domain-containing homing endonuclease [Pseudomonas atacamensis]|uniref:Hint domain-containing homing endonuclease n=1 Tax=Pseudomonas atacamensis TaxID=2565368 RepID=UPI0019D0D843|nr:Hint domain-containing homing endonuclease [Pseudomonas atacamensis]QSL90510.1 hypothetical protein JWU58_27105 [Pseudomonas atacamensis]